MGLWSSFLPLCPETGGFPPLSPFKSGRVFCLKGEPGVPTDANTNHHLLLWRPRARTDYNRGFWDRSRTKERKEGFERLRAPWGWHCEASGQQKRPLTEGRTAELWSSACLSLLRQKYLSPVVRLWPCAVNSTKAGLAALPPRA